MFCTPHALDTYYLNAKFRYLGYLNKLSICIQFYSSPRDQDDPTHLLDCSLWSELDPFELELSTNELPSELLADYEPSVNIQDPILSETVSVQGQEQVTAPDSPTSPDLMLLQYGWVNSLHMTVSPHMSPTLRKVRCPQHHHQHLPLHPRPLLLT